MGQQNDTNRNASLDEHKERAAGRQNETKGPYQGNVDDFDIAAKPGSGTAGGAFGEDKNAKSLRGGSLSGGGGGGGAQQAPKD